MRWDRMVIGTTLGAALGAATPAGAEIEEARTPQGVARVEGVPQGLYRLVVGGRTALAVDEFPVLWIEAQAGSLLLVGLSEGGTACPALWTWVDAGDPGFRRSETFGTCSDLVESVTHDSETVTVTLGSSDDDHPFSAFTWDGRGAVVEAPQGQPPSGAPPGGDPRAWVGRLPFELVRTSDWRPALVALMGEEGYDRAQEAIGSASPMEVQGKWVAGAGFDRLSGGSGAVAISLDDGRLLVALRDAEGAPPQLWGDPRGPLPPAVAEVVAGAP